MSRCLNCNYELVFLEKRHKFKCAKCSSLFTEEEIKLKEFRKYNKSQRIKEKTEAKKEKNKELNTRFKETNQNYTKEYYQKNKEKIAQKSRKYYQEHKEEISRKRKEKAKDGNQNELRKNRRVKNIESTRINGRIEHWKRKQKIMAESRFEEFVHERTCTTNIQRILPTLVLP